MNANKKESPIIELSQYKRWGFVPQFFRNVC